MEELRATRNLTISQTLDEILGIDRVSTASSTSTTTGDKNSLSSACRPPTRHGRESAASSSNEENREQPSSRKSTPMTKQVDDADDEFMKKINEIRRRSIISMELSNTPSTSALPPRLPIHVEVDEVHGSSTPTISPGVHKSTSNLTFRVDEPKEDSAKKKEKTMTAKIETKSRVFNDPTSDSHFSKWLSKKQQLSQKEKERKKAEAEGKEQAEKERRVNSAKLFERWKVDADERIRIENQKRKEKEKKKKEAEKAEQERKKAEAQKNFEAWKRERSKSVGDLKKRHEQTEEQKRRAKEAEKAEKEKEAKAAFDAWLAKKGRGKSATNKSKTENDEETKQYRMLMAQEAYETWLEMKEQEREMLADMVLIEAPPTPWIPPSRLIPRQFVRTANGSRRRSTNKPASRSQSAKSIRTRPTSNRAFR